MVKNSFQTAYERMDFSSKKIFFLCKNEVLIFFKKPPFNDAQTKD